MINLKLIINPFERIAGGLALSIGLLVILMAGFIAGDNGTHFPNLLSVLYTVPTGPFTPVAEIAASTLLLSMFSVISALVCRANFRTIDIIGTIFLSRAPYSVLAVAGYLSYLNMSHQLWSLIIVPIIVGCIAWSMALLYHALRVSTNLKGYRLWLSFAIVTVASEILTRLFMKKIYLLIL